jgi:hypothetical protein
MRSADLNQSSSAEDGLKVMARNHIHCAAGLAGDVAVTSGTSLHFIGWKAPYTHCHGTGMRANCDLFIYLDVAAMLAGSFSPLYRDSAVELTIFFSTHGNRLDSRFHFVQQGAPDLGRRWCRAEKVLCQSHTQAGVGRGR